MVTKAQQETLDKIAKNIREGVSSSGGDWNANDLLKDENRKYSFTHEEYEYLKQKINEN